MGEAGVLNGHQVKYAYEVFEVNSRRKLLSGTDTKVVHAPPFAIDDQGELEIHLETRCRLHTYYEIRSMLKNSPSMKHFIGDSAFTVKAQLLSYIEPNSTKEIIIGHAS